MVPLPPLSAPPEWSKRFSALSVSGGAVSVDAGQKVNVEGSAGNTYMSFNSTTNRLEFYVNGEVGAYMEN